jgi:hypothetical protein
VHTGTRVSVVAPDDVVGTRPGQHPIYIQEEPVWLLVCMFIYLSSDIFAEAHNSFHSSLFDLLLQVLISAH